MVLGSTTDFVAVSPSKCRWSPTQTVVANAAPTPSSMRALGVISRMMPVL
jgi:hypothetical protein